MKVEKLNKFSFKFEDIDLIYPVYIKCKDKEGYYNFRKSVTNSNYSRKYQLDNRSTQDIIFDKLIELNHFKLLGLDYNFIPEFPLINTRPDIDPNRSYYLLDYFIPDLSLAIELDSSYHDQTPIKDKLKDQFLNSIGIDVVRIDNFQLNTKSKLNSLIQYIKRKKEVKFELSYEELIEEYKEYINVTIPKSKYGDLYFIKKKWKPVVELFCSLDPEFKRSLICHFPYTITLTLDDLFNLIPMSKKETAKYNSLVNYLKKFNISLDIKSWTKSTR